MPATQTRTSTITSSTRRPPRRNAQFKHAVPKLHIRPIRGHPEARFAPCWQQALILRALASIELRVPMSERDIWPGVKLVEVVRAAAVPGVLCDRHLTHLADLGLVLILSSTHQRLREFDQFSLTRLGKAAAQQLRAPVALWRLQRDQEAISR